MIPELFSSTMTFFSGAHDQGGTGWCSHLELRGMKQAKHADANVCDGGVSSGLSVSTGRAQRNRSKRKQEYCDWPDMNLDLDRAFSCAFLILDPAQHLSRGFRGLRAGNSMDADHQENS